MANKKVPKRKSIVKVPEINKTILNKPRDLVMSKLECFDESHILTKSDLALMDTMMRWVQNTHFFNKDIGLDIIYSVDLDRVLSEISVDIKSRNLTIPELRLIINKLQKISYKSIKEGIFNSITIFYDIKINTRKFTLEFMVPENITYALITDEKNFVDQQDGNLHHRGYVSYDDINMTRYGLTPVARLLYIMLLNDYKLRLCNGVVKYEYDDIRNTCNIKTEKNYNFKKILSRSVDSIRNKTGFLINYEIIIKGRGTIVEVRFELDEFFINNRETSLMTKYNPIEVDTTGM